MKFVKERTNANRHFLFEIPWNSWSWQMPQFAAEAITNSVWIVEGPMCAHGLFTSGRAKLVRKPTGWITKNRSLLFPVTSVQQ